MTAQLARPVRAIAVLTLLFFAPAGEACSAFFRNRQSFAAAQLSTFSALLSLPTSR